MRRARWWTNGCTAPAPGRKKSARATGERCTESLRLVTPAPLRPLSVDHEVVIYAFLSEFVDNDGVALAVPFGENSI